MSLAIAYGVKRKNKKASGGLITSDSELRKAADYELGKENEASKEAVKTTKGQMPPRDDIAQNMDPRVTQKSQDNESLNPMREPEQSSKNLNMRSGIQTLPEEELDHDEILPHSAESMERVMPEDENLPAYMAHGGMLNPKRVAMMIMKKAKGGMVDCYGQGGLVNNGDEELHGDEKAYVAIDRMPSNPWNEIEGDGELRENMKKRARLSSIMQNLR